MVAQIRTLVTDWGVLTVTFATNYNYQRTVGYVTTHVESEIEMPDIVQVS